MARFLHILKEKGPISTTFIISKLLSTLNLGTSFSELFLIQTLTLVH
jgi:hypothetical protein